MCPESPQRSTSLHIMQAPLSLAHTDLSCPRRFAHCEMNRARPASRVFNVRLLRYGNRPETPATKADGSDGAASISEISQSHFLRCYTDVSDQALTLGRSAIEGERQTPVGRVVQTPYQFAAPHTDNVENRSPSERTGMSKRFGRNTELSGSLSRLKATRVGTR